jgi:hypothetical protein
LTDAALSGTAHCEIGRDHPPFALADASVIAVMSIALATA